MPDDATAVVQAVALPDVAVLAAHGAARWRLGGRCRAFQSGAPPHGGCAFGIDRVVMLLVGAKNLREITLFPMNQQAQDLLMNAPSPATPTQLRELALRVVPSKKD